MAEIIQLTDPTNYRRVAERIKKLFAEDFVKYSNHTMIRFAQRTLDAADVKKVIREGRIVSHEPSAEHPGCWLYRIDGNSIDNRSIRVIVEVNGRLIIVTVIDRDN